MIMLQHFRRRRKPKSASIARKAWSTFLFCWRNNLEFKGTHPANTSACK